MKRLSLLIFFALSSSLYGSGFDSAILWIYDIPDGSSDFFSTETMKLCDRRFQTSMLYSKPYGIGAVDWNNVFVRKGFGRWGAFARFNSYGLRDYYSRYIYNVGAAIKMRNSLSVSFDGQYHFEHFDRIGGFGRSELNARFSYYRGTVYSVLGLSGIRIDEDYKSSSGGARAWGALTYLLKNGMSFSGSVKRFENGRNEFEGHRGADREAPDR